ncbi:MAG: PatB family C-S lyase [Gammaproteobacteria bacterium]
MEFDFDNPPDRRDSDSIKWAKYDGRHVLPMWVADMDFASPPCVIEALHARVSHGVFGYGQAPVSLHDAVVDTLNADFNWRIDPSWIVWLPGLVPALNMVCRAFCDSNEATLTATPIYPPFLKAPLFSQRECVKVPLQLSGDRWLWDLAAAEAAVSTNTRVLMLCNPHNPVGRAWTHDELLALAAFAERHDLIVCSDEIHADLILDPSSRHVPFASLDAAAARNCITLMAPSKTYNIPGLGCSMAIVENEALRRRLRTAMRGIIPDVNVMGFAAAEAAYRHGRAWRAALIEYLRANTVLVSESIRAIVGLKTYPVQATYLSWIDARDLGVADPHIFFEEAGVGLSNGADFGAPGFVRLNFGCPRERLRLALVRMKSAVANRRVGTKQPA